jgi:hypothetical protein
MPPILMRIVIIRIIQKKLRTKRIIHSRNYVHREIAAKKTSLTGSKHKSE